MSGGVDSAVAALLRRRASAVAVTLELWADAENDAEASCCSAHAVRVARSLAHGMGMPHFTLDLRAEFRAGVVEPFLAGHAAGETPNPCVRLQRPRAARRDARVRRPRSARAALATGHYARVHARTGCCARAADPAKDQAYMLARCRRRRWRGMRFPLGELTKPEVRALAAEAGLPVASQGRVAGPLLPRRHRPRARSWPATAARASGRATSSTAAARVLGRHRGHHGFTVGQRKGIGVAAPEPLYVLATDARTNRVTVGARAELATREVAVRGARLHRPARRGRLACKLRYRSKPLPCTVAEQGTGRLTLHLGEPSDGAAPGQTACLYAGDVVVGYGTIA